MDLKDGAMKGLPCSSLRVQVLQRGKEIRQDAGKRAGGLPEASLMLGSVCEHVALFHHLDSQHM